MTDLDAIADRFGLTPDARVALRALWDARAIGATMIADSFEAPEPAPTEPAPTERAPTPERYEDLGLIGMGGMGEVRRVRDRELNRVLAMKIIRPELAKNRGVLSRFVEEAQATAQLEHPGIVPVHELGRLPDGRVYFTMTIVRGQTLTNVIDDVHDASDGGRWGVGASGWTFARLVDAFRRVCEAVAHAHARGVIHRDLKPDNVMVGAYGEVLVLDWGLAKVLGRAPHDEDGELDDLDAVATDRSRDDALQTRIGTVAGTPAYMSPEQAKGRIDQLAPPSDVYALGCILYEILSGRPPYQAEDPMDVLRQVLVGPPPPPAGPGPIPDELFTYCLKAMERDPADRYPHAGALAEEITNWQEGAKRRDHALQIVAEAQAAWPQVAARRDRAAGLRAKASDVLDELRPWDGIDRKKPAWDLQDEASRLESEAELEELRVTQLLQAALTQSPDLPEAHALLADLYRARHAEAEAGRDRRAAARYEALLRAHDDGRYAAYLEGNGALTLVTDPPGAEVELYRYADRDRRLVAEPVVRLGKTPLHDVALPMGSWLCVLRAPGREPVRYPVHIGREDPWTGVRPQAASAGRAGAGGDRAPWPVRLPKKGELGPDDVYVPPGPAWLGGDPDAKTSLVRRRVWVDGFVVRRFPVTNREYLAFLNDLVGQGRVEEALRHAPRERGGTADKQGALVYGRTAGGGFELHPDADGDAWHPDWPVLLVDWPGASAYAGWYAKATGAPWRLLRELEWEKAGRGVDGRFFPWGDFQDPTWACTRDSRPGRPLPSVVDGYPIDESPYGVRGLAGNVSEWCADVFRRDGPLVVSGLLAPIADADDDPGHRAFRGGAWSNTPNFARLCHRREAAPGWRNETIGFRLARSGP